ncbi:MAG: DUF5606 domain-containing protein [Bacteroidales bacterium]|nr:DUF5606 domain-containing protein [Bacteroidales bacterium]
MDLSEILTISGKPGLYKQVAQTKNGIIIESLIDKKRSTAFTHEKISSLEEISIFTNNDDLSLKEVFKLIYDKQSGKQAISHKSDNNKLKEFFEEIIPEYDKERVYVSDIKKVVNWYNILQENEILDFSEEDKSEPESEENEKQNEVTEEKDKQKDEAKENKEKEDK